MVYNIDDIYILKTVHVPLEQSDLEIGEHRNTAIVPLSASVFYQCLTTSGDDSRQLYDDYVFGMMSTDNASSYDDFISLYNNIKDDGYDCEQTPELTIRRYVEDTSWMQYASSGMMPMIPLIIDGQHRAAILKCLGYKTISCDGRYGQWPTNNLPWRPGFDRCIKVSKG